MDKDTSRKKLIIAVLQGDDYADTVDELNRSGFSPPYSAPPAAF